MTDKAQLRSIVEQVLMGCGVVADDEAEEIADAVVERADEEGFFESENSSETLKDLLD
jgi:hypothetical protein